MFASKIVKSPRSRSRNASRTIAAILAATAISVIASEARAVTITNISTNTVVFQDDFESGDFLPPTVGTWGIGPEVTVTSSTTPPNPGPAEGSFYARGFRDDASTFGEGNMVANLSAPQDTVGQLVRMSAMLYIPNDGDASRAVFVLADTTASANARAFVRSDGAGNVIAVTSPGLTSVDSGLDYTPDTWQQWEIEYAVGSAQYRVRVNGFAAGPFASPTLGQVRIGEIFNGSAEPGAFFVDAVPIPEPSTSLFCVAAFAIGFRRSAFLRA